jgi:3-isopropylmalate dehydrogenase
MLLRYSLGLEKAAKAVEEAVRKALDENDVGGVGLRTADIGGDVSTEEMGNGIIEELKKLL